VNAVSESFAVDRDTVPCGILHGLIAMAGKAVRLGLRLPGCKHQQAEKRRRGEDPDPESFAMSR
jgi:hypothetical protein